jgi:large subunit ribosomal protein L7/L12
VTTQNLEDIVQALSNLKVTDLAKLKKLLEEAWGVTAAAPVAMAVASAPSAAKAPEAAAESTEFQVTLESVPADKKIGAIKVVREVTGLGLKEAKDIVEGAPKVLKETAPKAEAEEIVKKVEAAGAKATLKGL